MMLWLIWDILVPLALAFLAGLFFGWLFWRWRRMQITSEELAAMRRSSARYKSDADMLRNRNAELAERLRASNGASDSTTLQDLAAANKRIDKLRDQLKTANRELARHQQNINTKIQTGSRSETAVPREAKADKVRDLESQLSVARRQIQMLESTASSGQGRRVSISGVADAASGQNAGGADYGEEIAIRDKMIATLTHSLEQYGAQQDTTALLAEIELRDERIIALENLLNDGQRVA